MRKNRIDIKWYLLAIGVSAGILLGTWLYWTYFPFKTIEFKSLYRTEQITYHKGDQTHYVVDYCKYTNAPATIIKEFVDGLKFSVESPQAVLQVGCRSQEIDMTIPETLPYGRYRLHNVVTYYVSPTQSISKDNWSNWFYVVPDTQEHQDEAADLLIKE
jgi:hypothetical protein